MSSGIPRAPPSHSRLKTRSSRRLSGLSLDDFGGYGDKHQDMIVIGYNRDSFSDPDQQQYGFYDLETDGALRGGGRRKLFTRKTIGLVLNYAGIGIMYGALPATTLPFLKYYLNMQSYQVQAASAIVNAAWSFKTFGGIITDSFPIFGYRRKSYMILGWMICVACLIGLSSFSMPQPYYYPGERNVHVLNADAPNSGWKYSLVMAGATFGYFFANVASDGMVVEIAQREPLHCRGETQAIIYASRSLFMIFAEVFIGTSFNGVSYGGTFDWSLDFSVVMLCLAITSIIPLIGSIFFLHEDRQFTRLSFRQRCKEMWRIAQTRAVWQVLVFELIGAFCLSFTSSASVSVATNWARVEPFQKSIASVVTRLIYTVALYLTKLYLLEESWVKMFCVTTVWIIIVRFFYIGCTIFDIVRNQHFWLYIQAFEQPPSALRFLLFTFPIAEIAEEGFEGTTFGLVTTFHNMAIPLGVSAYKSIDSFFDISDKEVFEDSPHVRWNVFYTYVIAWCVQLASMMAIFLLPRQKLEIQQLLYYGGHSKMAGAFVLTVLFLVVVYSTATNALSLFKETACLRIAGGSGCKT
ncbi:hypothetical protein Poli38472_005648 [Pythium oligandrum]|uniref:Transmembrane protein n=1 Tax=Pythium oligandrum TaxID=41045 RepID=A0A8K1FGQ6_PYTOL|nr:hypothetical protein Poli38472_005648 [Pythium oligandrum]|eukprot:TMW63030.1 hypothetical protein Poli38472_005648 [Pythium oligandrum]